ncbi:MAG TPA: Gfo/Idh/MocA family oxidoreductase [Plantibacter sp.]|uniref:Gfo/Idh/MocA family protein n=1 Tax=unclassified Plantibacter TaxID=2624265 RepID=UPI002D117DD1|nr:Gfo/Idh/MocA family oxidoreductase [Plantibacter sp.]
MNTPPPPATIGLIGAGNISRRYIAGIARFSHLRVVAVTDAVPAAARQLAAEAGITAHDTLSAMLDDDGIDIVVNITPPLAHAAVTVQALQAGKHVYVEKPMAAALADAELMIAAAAKTGMLLGSAPDTFLGSASQTARAAIDRGDIGEPIGVVAFITHSQAERWHPNPGFLFQPGGGPLLDMGPYYVAGMVNLLGPVARVSGTTRIGASKRAVTAPDRVVDEVSVTTTTHASATLTFASGVVGTLVASFDIWESHLPKIEVYGTEGALSVPDPNHFDGPVLLRRNDADVWTELEPALTVSGAPDSPEQLLRGIGVADLVGAIEGGHHRADSALALHVLEVLEAVESSSSLGREVHIISRPDRPAPQGPTATIASN